MAGKSGNFEVAARLWRMLEMSMPENTLRKSMDDLQRSLLRSDTHVVDIILTPYSATLPRLPGFAM